jgi:RNA polymerase sigma factor (sigma-70 family)
LPFFGRLTSYSGVSYQRTGGRPTTDDRELAELARKGDVRAYERLIEAYQQVAFRVAYVITRSAADAEDATQEAFVKAYYALPRFRAGASFRPWLLRIVANEARNRVRSAGRRAALALRFEADRARGSSGTSGGAASSPEVLALGAEERRALVDAIHRLGDRDRDVIALRYFLDLSEAEMAAVLGCAKGTVKSRLARALSRLRAALPVESEVEA